MFGLYMYLALVQILVAFL